MKQFVRIMKHDKRAFLFPKKKFIKINDVKVKESIFVGPQILELMHDSEFQ